MTLSGPLHGDFYLSFDTPLAARTDSGDVRLRVIGSGGYPHDIRVGQQAPGKLRGGRVFAPVVDAGHDLVLDFDAEPVKGEFKILCANCFAEIWSTMLANAVDPGSISAEEQAFWSADTQPGCPRCHAAAARAH